MKKIHKTGIAIISALAPACALGVVGGVVIANLTKEETGNATETQWLDWYTTARDKYVENCSQNKIYTKDDITSNIISGDAKVNASSYQLADWQYNQGLGGYIAIFGNPAGFYGPVGSEATQQEQQQKFEYYKTISSKSIFNVDENGAWFKFKDDNGNIVMSICYNANGYVTKQIYNYGGTYEEINITYNQDPYIH